MSSHVKQASVFFIRINRRGQLSALLVVVIGSPKAVRTAFHAIEKPIHLPFGT